MGFVCSVADKYICMYVACSGILKTFIFLYLLPVRFSAAANSGAAFVQRSVAQMHKSICAANCRGVVHVQPVRGPRVYSKCRGRVCTASAGAACVQQVQGPREYSKCEGQYACSKCGGQYVK